MIDEGLILASQKGDSRAFARLLESIYDMIFHFALRWAGHVCDAEDITQQVCVKLAKVIQSFRFESAFTTWLYRLVVNCAHDWARREKKHRQTELGADESSGSAVEAESSAELQRVLSLVDAMGKGFKDTLLLVYAEGLSHREAADVLGVKESTVSWRLHEIKKQLRSSGESGVGDER